MTTTDDVRGHGRRNPSGEPDPSPDDTPSPPDDVQGHARRHPGDEHADTGDGSCRRSSDGML